MTSSLALVETGGADPLERIEAERVQARLELEAAERDMLADAAFDPDGFAEAKARRQAAEQTLDRLDWAEKAERHRQEQAARDAKMAKLREIQQAASEAHDRARAIASAVTADVRRLIDGIRALKDCQAVIDRSAHHEQFAVNAGDIPKRTVRPRLVLDADDAVLALRAAREYLRLAQVSEQLADMRASQGKL